MRVYHNFFLYGTGKGGFFFVCMVQVQENVRYVWYFFLCKCMVLYSIFGGCVRYGVLYLCKTSMATLQLLFGISNAAYIFFIFLIFCIIVLLDFWTFRFLNNSSFYNWILLDISHLLDFWTFRFLYFPTDFPFL